MDVTVERLSPADLEPFRELRLAALRDAPSAFWATYEQESTYGPDKWTAFLTAAQWYVATLEGEPAGIVGVLRRPELIAEPEVIGLWVAPGARRRGIARRLLSEAGRWAERDGAQALTLWILEHNHGARRLYETAGFGLTGERIALPRDPNITELRMRKVLGAKTGDASSKRSGTTAS